MTPRTFDPSPDAIVGRPMFNSYFMAGFECSSHRLRSGRRLDMVAATDHEKFALLDYARIKARGMRVAREGIRWHLVEQTAGKYDFSSVRPILQAAQATGTQVIWDLCHFGWPDELDALKPEFVSRLAQFGAAFARLLKEETDLAPFFVPINEISFFSWAGGEEGALNPHVTGRGFELKCQLVRASIAAMESIWAVDPLARFVHVDPIIHVAAHPDRPEDRPLAEEYRLSQFQAWDMLAGRLWPELGGKEKYLDVIGVNYYFHNQWYYDIKGFRRMHEFKPLSRANPDYRPLREILNEVYERYRRPMFIAETGAEDSARGPWLKYVTSETSAALSTGVPVSGMCLYPILNHPGWNDGRHCRNGLWDYADENGDRKIYEPLAGQLRRSQKLLETAARESTTAVSNGRPARRSARPKRTGLRGAGKKRRLTPIETGLT